MAKKRAPRGGKKIYEQIVDRLKELITRGELTAGDRLLLPVVCANDTTVATNLSVELAGAPAQSVGVFASSR